jgi:hypothetical protein
MPSAKQPAVISEQSRRRAGQGTPNSVLAEVERLRGSHAPHGALEELLAALRAQVEAQPLTNVVADLIIVGILQAFEDVLDFLEMIAIGLFIVRRRGIESGVNLHLHDVTEITLGIEFPPAQIAFVSNH